MLPRYPADYWFVIWRCNGRILGEAHIPNEPPNAREPVLTVVHKIQHVTYHITDIDGDISVGECKWFAEQYHFGKTHLVRQTIQN